MERNLADIADPEVAQRWPGLPTSPVKAVWPAEAPQLQFAVHGCAGGTVALHRVQVNLESALTAESIVFSAVIRF